jgi:hypothetical protein
MDIERKSDLLFGRYQALQILLIVARSPKPEIHSGRVARILTVETGIISKEFARLVELGVLEQVSRRGDYRRMESVFWTMIEALGDEWGA